MSVIKIFAPDEPELSTIDIARKVGIPKPTAYRLLTTLVYGGLLEYYPATGKYTIGPQLYFQGSLYSSISNVHKAAEQVIRTLNVLTNEAVSIGIRQGAYITIVMREKSRHALRFSGVHIGSTFPAYVTSHGKALLSELTEAEIDNLFPEERLRQFTPKTIKTKAELKRELEKTRKTGIGFMTEERDLGVEAVAAIIRDATGNSVAAISIGVPIARINRTRREQLATLVRMGASLTSYRLGYRDVVTPVCDIKEIQSWWDQNSLKTVKLR